VTLRQLEIFVAVARARSFRRAAEQIALSQPALSQQVKELERELGAPVFDRLGRTIGLTDAGRALEEHAQRVFATLQGAREAIAELRGLERGTLRLGGSTTPGIYLLPRLLGRFKQRYPRVALSLRIGNSREIEERVRATEVDLALVGGHVSDARETCVEARLVDRLALIVPSRHPWARRRQIAPERLADECLLLREEGSATRRVTESALARAGVTTRTWLELGHTEAIKHGVQAGLGVAFVSRYAIQSELADGRLRVVGVRGLAIQRHFHLIRHEAKALSPAARAFLGFLHDDPAVRARGVGPPGLPRARPV
jgi:DNA-binding transcriptional LysR family regulator